jgi:hypothetical protein
MKTEPSTIAKMVFIWFINQFFLVLKIDTVLIREFPADGGTGRGRRNGDHCLLD